MSLFILIAPFFLVLLVSFFVQRGRFSVRQYVAGALIGVAAWGLLFLLVFGFKFFQNPYLMHRELVKTSCIASGYESMIGIRNLKEKTEPGQLYGYWLVTSGEKLKEAFDEETKKNFMRFPSPTKPSDKLTEREIFSREIEARIGYLRALPE